MRNYRRVVPGKEWEERFRSSCFIFAEFPVIVHTLQKFQAARSIDCIILVLPEGEISTAWEAIRPFGLTKVVRIVSGGKERQDSVRRGIESLDGDVEIVVIHDAVRPFISEAHINLAVSRAVECGAVVIGVPVKDTIKSVDNGIVRATLERRDLWITQTPQVFPRGILEEAFDRAYADRYYGTDDASLVERIGASVTMVKGSYENIKLTTPEDMAYGEFILARKAYVMRTGIGYDSHRLAVGHKLILGGVDIPSEVGLVGHSDADALTHAIIDALLGAMGMGDIGVRFPDTDPVYLGISSLKLLKEIAKLIVEEKYSVQNIDASIILEKPKLSPYTDGMKKNIAGILRIREHAVNIKAKTNEKMGFVGKNEGIAVIAIATLTTS